MTIIETAAIAWAVVATGGAIVVERLCAWQLRESAKALKGAATELGNSHRQTMEALDQRDTARRALANYHAAAKRDLSAHMREIGLRGNQSPKRKAAQQRAARDARTAELARGVAAETTRRAA